MNEPSDVLFESAEALEHLMMTLCVLCDRLLDEKKHLL